MNAFWRKMKDYTISVKFYDCEQSTDIEEMYQEFKVRLLNELRVDVRPPKNISKIIDVSDKDEYDT